MWVTGLLSVCNLQSLLVLLASFFLFCFIQQVGLWKWKLSLFLHLQRKHWLQGVKGLSLKEITHCCNVFGCNCTKNRRNFIEVDFSVFPFWNCINYLSYIDYVLFIQLILLDSFLADYGSSLMYILSREILVPVYKICYSEMIRNLSALVQTCWYFGENLGTDKKVVWHRKDEIWEPFTKCIW